LPTSYEKCAEGGRGLVGTEKKRNDNPSIVRNWQKGEVERVYPMYSLIEGGWKVIFQTEGQKQFVRKGVGWKPFCAEGGKKEGRENREWRIRLFLESLGGGGDEDGRGG